MKQYKIIVIQHCLKQNKVAKFGEIVSESQLTSPASELIEAGFIEEVSGQIEIEVTAQHLEDNPELVDAGVEAGEIVVVDAEDIEPIEEEAEEAEEAVETVIAKEDIKDIKKAVVKK